MIEKVNPSHPDKVADRIAGALVDLAYKKQESPKVAVEVLIGHGSCHIICETSVKLDLDDVKSAVNRIAGLLKVDYKEVPQDVHLAENQAKQIRCGDNGIFKGSPVNREEYELSSVAHALYEKWPTDGKFIFDRKNRVFIACQSNADREEVKKYLLWLGREDFNDIIVNPLGDWTGGTDVDTGATNRKLGSDMGSAVTGGGLHGKDLSKADVAVNIVCYMLAQKYHTEVSTMCAIGDDSLSFTLEGRNEGVFMMYYEVVREAKRYINYVGGFEKLAEWGLF